MTYTAGQVEAAFDGLKDDEGYEVDWWEIAYEEINDGVLDIDGTKVAWNFEESKTAGEGDYSADTWVVVKVGDQFFRKDGHYQSFEGDRWDGGLYEVQPAKKVVKVWRKV